MGFALVSLALLSNIFFYLVLLILISIYKSMMGYNDINAFFPASLNLHNGYYRLF